MKTWKRFVGANPARTHARLQWGHVDEDVEEEAVFQPPN